MVKFWPKMKVSRNNWKHYIKWTLQWWSFWESFKLLCQTDKKYKDNTYLRPFLVTWQLMWMLTRRVSCSKPVKLTRNRLRRVRIKSCAVLKVQGCNLDGFEVYGCFLDICVNLGFKYGLLWRKNPTKEKWYYFFSKARPLLHGSHSTAFR